MASPHVAGVAALIRQLDPTLTPADVTRMIEMQALSDVITDVGPGSPNLLLQIPSLTCELPLLPPLPPTFAPTRRIHTFRLDLTTDRYAVETSWDLRDPSDRIVASGSGYANSSPYEEIVYIDDGEYRFTIYDSVGDGICCGYGDGLYSLKVNDDLVMLESGGVFTGVSESTSFGDVTSTSPSLQLSPSPSSLPSATPSVMPSFSKPSRLPSLSPSTGPSTSPSTAPSTSPSTRRSARGGARGSTRTSAWR